MIKDKFIAFFIHIVSSVLVVSIFTIVLIVFWYPEPYFTSSGGWQGLKLVAFIDIILGPSLTFIIFNKNKSTKELRTDIGIIACIQIIALSWGCYTVYLQRPIATVFWEQNFYTVPEQALSNLYPDSPLLDDLKANPNKLYIVIKPTSVNEKDKILEESLAQQIPAFQLLNRFKPFSDHFDSIKGLSIDIHEIINTNQAMKLKLDIILRESQTKIDDNFYFPLISKYRNIILVFNAKAQLLGFIKAPYKNT